jgi:vacuolar-type H+-ATPase subunit C/Vma6
MKEEDAAMISQSCDIKEFIEAIKDKDYLDAIYLADKEATEAERLKFRSHAATAPKNKGCARYADKLKGFINFMRYGVKDHFLEGHDLKALQSIRESLLAKDSLTPDL